MNLKHMTEHEMLHEAYLSREENPLAATLGDLVDARDERIDALERALKELIEHNESGLVDVDRVRDDLIDLHGATDLLITLGAAYNEIDAATTDAANVLDKDD